MNVEEIKSQLDFSGCYIIFRLAGTCGKSLETREFKILQSAR